MKIGVMPNIFPKISKTFILDQITGMIDRGHNVSIFAPQSADESVQHPAIREYDILGRTTYFGSPDSLPMALIGAVRNSATLAMSTPTSSSTILRIAREQGIKSAGRFTYQAYPVLRADVDVLHAHFGPVGRQAAKLDRIGNHDSFITSFHGTGIRESEEHGRRIYAELFEHCDCLLANTKYTRKKLIEFGADPDMVRVHHVGVDPEKFQPSDSEDESGPLTILTVARLHDIKGLEYGVLAIKELSRRLHDVDIRYRIVGGGPLEEDLRELVRANDLDDIVTLCGPVDQEGVVDELQSADVFLLPSLHEGFGMVLLEAQAIELPVVVSDVGGTREAVSPGESALLVPPRNPYVIADQLEYLARNPSKRAEIGAAGRSNVLENFNISCLNDELEDIYINTM